MPWNTAEFDLTVERACHVGMFVTLVTNISSPTVYKTDALAGTSIGSLCRTKGAYRQQAGKQSIVGPVYVDMPKRAG